MHRITVWKHDERLKQIRIEERVFSIGRGNDNSLSLEDRQVSKHHAEIRKGFTGIYVKDLGSANGTRVNGVPVIGKEKLKAGDHVHVGPFNLHFDPQRLLGADEELVARTNRTIVFEAVSGPEKGLLLRENLARFSIGSGEHCDLRLSRDPDAAKRHAVVRLEGEQFFITDHSGGGTCVNKIPVRHHVLVSGDLVRLGGSVFSFSELDFVE